MQQLTRWPTGRRFVGRRSNRRAFRRFCSNTSDLSTEFAQNGVVGKIDQPGLLRNLCDFVPPRACGPGGQVKNGASLERRASSVTLLIRLARRIVAQSDNLRG